MEDNSRFGEWWPDVERTIRSMLVGRRAAPADIDDILQLTAERALTAKVDLPTEQAFGRWCTTVAKNLFVDEYRRANRYQRAEMPEQVDRWNPEDVVVASEIRPLVERLLDRLTDRERWAFNWEGPRPEDRLERNQFNVALHRAVKRLEKGYGELSVLIVTGIARFRERVRGGGTPPPAVAAAGVAMAIATFLGIDDTSANRSADRSTGAPVGTRSSISNASADRINFPGAAHTGVHITTSPADPPNARRGAPISRVTIPLPRYDGERHDVVIRPTEEQDQGNLFCGGHTAVTPYFCIKSPLPSIDEFVRAPV